MWLWVKQLLTRPRINCRLPQTPRTPSTAAAHYFDDIFSRSAKPNGSRTPRIRRSSTSRSIGNRSDFATTINGDALSTNGDDIDEGGLADQAARQEAEQHLNNYVANQLERVRRRESVADYEDEFEAQLDGFPNGR